MRIATALGLGVVAAGLLTACDDGTAPIAPNTSTTPGTLIENPPLRVASLTQAALVAQFSATTSGQQLLQLAGTPKCGVDFHYIQYQTVGGAGESATASGALMIPTGGTGCTGARPIVLYAHGTAATKGYNIANITDSTNEAWSESALIAALFAAQGYIVVAPNYAGYDSSSLSYHPYLNGTQQSTEMINSLEAALSGLPNTAAGASTKSDGLLLLTGYSQGGYVAMATHKAIQTTPITGITLLASAPMSGPYALEAFGDTILFGNVDLGSTEFLPLMTTSYQNSYGNVYTSTSQVYSSTYATGIDTLLPNAVSFETLVSEGKLPLLALFDCSPPSTGISALDADLAPPSGCGSAATAATGFGTPALMNDTARIGYALDAWSNPDGGFPPNGDTTPPAGAYQLATSPTFGLRVDLKKNDMRTWIPTGAAPILMCGGHDDPTVFFASNTGVMEGFWPSALFSAQAVTVLDVDPDTGSGIATTVANVAATVFATDLAASASATKIATDIETAVIGTYPSYFTITASGATPNSAQGVLVEEIAGVAAETVLTEYAAGVTSPSTMGTDVATAIEENYHGSLVPPACGTAVQGFFAQILALAGV
jgi:pimeloyl-ACP methyl ester carboxylesterase